MALASQWQDHSARAQVQWQAKLRNTSCKPQWEYCSGHTIWDREKTYSIPAKLGPSLHNTIKVFLCQQKHNVSPTAK
ncbi:hypothetical protein L873DRAFT_1810840 [Choiromyces venosus 120613-1]|uniref:Uncharacterized protein n=1 Tax=Choiromyces venosus 120613-1 TaxID=1336337 RepID=A0A3N4JK54_9PEZI|nr:hypothetical protein L873DRAFT_1810840 [Choiromyces venosus 120613-1]